MSYILMLWTIVAHGSYTTATDWRPMAQFETAALCEAAAASMNITNRYRCLKIKGETK